MFLITNVLVSKNAWAQLLESDTVDDIGLRGQKMGLKGGFDISQNIGNTAEIIIEAFLSLLGVIFIILMIIAGYDWMSAAGDERKVDKAKDTILRAIIGLIIIVSTYAITYFVFNHMPGGGEVPPYEFSN